MAAAQSNSTVTINGMANCQLAATGGLDDYAETTCDLPKGQFINLVNELVFSFTFTHIGIGEGELNFAWWKFERFGPPSPTSLPLSKSLSPIIHKVTLAFETFEMMAPESIVTCDGDGSPLLELVDNLDGSYGLRCELSGLYFCNGEGNKVTFVEGDADPCVKWGLAGVLEANYVLMSWTTKKFMKRNEGTGVLTVDNEDYIYPDDSVDRFVVDNSLLTFPDNRAMEM